MAKTVRIFWDKNDKTRFGLQTNPHEPPVFDPEINAYFTAMAQLNIEREQVGVFTFDLGFPCKLADTPWKLKPEEPRSLNPAHVRAIENIEKAINDPEQYAGKVETDENGEYTGFALSERGGS